VAGGVERFSSLLTPGVVFPGLSALDRDGVITEMVGGLRERFPGHDWGGVENTLMRREMMGSTAIGDFAAIPHARWNGGFFGAIGVSGPGIEFHSLDGKKAYVVFLLLSPPGKAGEHLKLLAGISRLAREAGVWEGIKTAGSAEEILSIIHSVDRKS